MRYLLIVFLLFLGCVSAPKYKVIHNENNSLTKQIITDEIIFVNRPGKNRARIDLIRKKTSYLDIKIEALIGYSLNIYNAGYSITMVIDGEFIKLTALMYEMNKKGLVTSDILYSISVSNNYETFTISEDLMHRIANAQDVRIEYSSTNPYIVLSEDEIALFRIFYDEFILKP